MSDDYRPDLNSREMAISSDFKRRIRELEEERESTLKGMRAMAEEHAAKLEAVTADRDEMQALFDLQWTRTLEADKLWRAAHPGNDNVSPDLGVLITWLIKRGDDARDAHRLASAAAHDLAVDAAGTEPKP